MKLIINFKGNEKSFNLEQDLEADIQTDAESLGYITSVLFETAKVLSEHLSNVNPKYRDRINKGIAHSMLEKRRENNPVYPFTKFLLEDEK